MLENQKLSPFLQEMLERVEADAKGKPVQLPLWPEGKRGTPNSLIRSALFAAAQGKNRGWLKEEVLASQDGIVVKYSGERLIQSDLDVWECLVHLARRHSLGHVCSFTAHGLLKALGLNTGNKDHRWLHSVILRLTACAVQVTHNGRTYFGSLVQSGAKHEITHHYTISLNPQLIRLYGDTQWTAIDWKQRQMLRRQPLAQALHAFYSTHSKPFTLKINTLHQLTGSQNAQMSGYKRQLHKALEILVQIGFLKGFTMEGERVMVERVEKSYLMK